LIILNIGKQLLDKTIICIARNIKIFIKLYLDSEVVDYQAHTNNFLSNSDFNLIETKNFINNQEKNDKDNLQNLAPLHNPIDLFINANKLDYNYNENSTYLENKNNFNGSYHNENRSDLNDFGISNLENLNELILIQLGIEEDNIKLIKYVSKDINNLIKILENYDIEKYYKFFISSESLSYSRSVDIEDERFLTNNSE